jgi:predicted NAD-dependent protein-ADP-ribosyltransferase YbiA (DUF1768 family)
MRVLLNPGVLVLVPETPTELASFTAWSAETNGHVFHLIAQTSGAALHDLGPHENACREPLNISYQPGSPWLPISNLALTPFFLDGRHYVSIEGFWQGLKFVDDHDRRRIATLYGVAAKHAGDAAQPHPHFHYQGKEIAVGTPAHWALMERACRAKFQSNADANQALLATGDRWLTHRMRLDSRTIPGVIMADIWMRIRADLPSSASPPSTPAS